MARIDAVGFETNSNPCELESPTTTGNGTIAISAAAGAVRSGSFGLLAAATAGTSSTAYATYTKAGTAPDAAIRLSMNVASVFVTDRVVADLLFGSQVARIRIAPDTALTYKARAEITDGTVEVSSYITGIPYGVMRDFVLTVDGGANPNIAVLSCAAGTATLSAANRITTNLSGWRVGLIDGVNDAISIGFDDVIIDSAAVAIPLTAQLLPLTPNAAGSADTLTAVGAGASTVRFSDTSDTTGGRGSGSAGVATKLNVTDTGVGAGVTASIPALYVSTRAGDTLDLGGKAAVGIRDSGSEAYSADFTSGLSPTTFRSRLVSTSRPGGGSWTAAAVDAVELGMWHNVTTGIVTDRTTFWKLWGYAEVVVGPSMTDSVSLAEAQTNLIGLTGVTDSVSVADTVASLKNVFSLTDAFSLVDAVASKAGVTLTDAATLAETLSAVLVGLGITDAATLSETVSSLSALVSVTDSASLAEALLIGAGLTQTDAATLAESSDVHVGLAVSDTAGLVDGVVVIIGNVALTDSASLAESILEAAGLPLVDTVTLAEGLFAQVYLAAIPDWPLNTPLKAIAGVAYNHETGAAYAGVTVNLIRDFDERTVVTQIADGAGAYSFDRGGDDPYTYHLYIDDSTVDPPYHGVSDRGIVPA